MSSSFLYVLLFAPVFVSVYLADLFNGPKKFTSYLTGPMRASSITSYLRLGHSLFKYTREIYSLLSLPSSRLAKCSDSFPGHSQGGIVCPSAG